MSYEKNENDFGRDSIPLLVLKKFQFRLCSRNLLMCCTVLWIESI